MNESTSPLLDGELVDAWLADLGSANTRNAYRLDLATFGTWCAESGTIPMRADAAALSAYQLAREVAGDSPATLRRRWSSLGSFYTFAMARQATTASPMSGVTRPKVAAGDPSPTTVLTPESVAEYRTMAARLDTRLEALVSLLVVDGLKLGEALALDVDDVSAASRSTTVTIRGRGGIRRVRVAPETARALRRCVARREEGPLFTSDRSASRGKGHRLTRFGADHLLKQLRTAAGSGVTANALRRYHISARHAAGGSLDDARDKAGLADVRGVRRYVEPINNEPINNEPTMNQPIMNQPTSTTRKRRST